MITLQRVQAPPRPAAGGRSISPRAFTLIELLTVIAIIAVLATLLASAVSSSKRQARQVASISNLRQISIAINLFRDDEQRRPHTFAELVHSRFLSAGVLKCPEDKLGDWGGMVQPPAPVVSAARSPSVAASYLHSFFWDERSWETHAKKPAAFGLAVCQLHGIGTQDPEAPSPFSFEGLIWRAQLDGAVVRRQVFWNQFARSELAVGDFSVTPNAPLDSASFDPLAPLFLDPP